MNLKETVAKFDLDNGDEYVRIGERLIFANGAQRDVNPWGQLVLPPENEHARLLIVAQYHAELVRRADADFSETKENLIAQARSAIASGHHPGISVEEAEQKLKEKLAKLRGCQRRHKRVLKQIEQTPEGRAKQQAKVDRANNIAAGEELVAAVTAIKQ